MVALVELPVLTTLPASVAAPATPVAGAAWAVLVLIWTVSVGFSALWVLRFLSALSLWIVRVLLFVGIVRIVHDSSPRAGRPPLDSCKRTSTVPDCTAAANKGVHSHT